MRNFSGPWKTLEESPRDWPNIALPWMVAKGNCAEEDTFWIFFRVHEKRQKTASKIPGILKSLNHLGHQFFSSFDPSFRQQFLWFFFHRISPTTRHLCIHFFLHSRLLHFFITKSSEPLRWISMVQQCCQQPGAGSQHGFSTYTS